MRAPRDLRRSLAAGARAAVVVARRVIEREQLQVVADCVALRERALRALELVACGRQKSEDGRARSGGAGGPCTRGGLKASRAAGGLAARACALPFPTCSDAAPVVLARVRAGDSVVLGDGRVAGVKRLARLEVGAHGVVVDEGAGLRELRVGPVLKDLRSARVRGRER